MNPKVFLSIVLPVYNEGKIIIKQIEDLEKKLKYRHEILVIYDFEQDTTVPYIKKLQTKYKQSFSSNKQSFSSNKNLSFAQNFDSRSARIKQSLWPSPSKNSTAGLESLRGLKNIYGRGVINAVKTGFKKFTGEAVVVMPADLADDPETINRMFKKFLQGYDIVCATRYAKGGRKIGGGFLKTALSRTAGIMTPLLLGIQTTDIANGFKMYRRKVIESMKIESTGGWEYSTEMVIKAHRAGFKIGEVPTIWRDRTSGKSKFKLLKWLPKYIRWYLWGILLRLNVNRLVV